MIATVSPSRRASICYDFYGFNVIGVHGRPLISFSFETRAKKWLGTAKIITGDVHERRAIWRIDQTAPEGRYALDNAGRISEMRDRAFTEVREQIPELSRHFFGPPADEFVPFHAL